MSSPSYVPSLFLTAASNQKRYSDTITLSTDLNDKRVETPQSLAPKETCSNLSQSDQAARLVESSLKLIASGRDHAISGMEDCPSMPETQESFTSTEEDWKISEGDGNTSLIELQDSSGPSEFMDYHFSFADKACQSETLFTSAENSNTFVVIKYYKSDQSETCDAEIQTNIFVKNVPKVLSYVNKKRGTDQKFSHARVGPDLARQFLESGSTGKKNRFFWL